MDFNIELDRNMVICNYDGKLNPKQVCYSIILLIKQYIFRNKCLGKMISIKGITREILQLHNIEKYIAAKENKLAKHYSKWSPVNLFPT